MEAQQIHDLRTKINQIRNTTKRAVTVQKYKRKSWDQLVSVEEAHDLLLKAEDSLKYATYWLGKVLGYSQLEEAQSKEDYAENGIKDSTKKGIGHEHKKGENDLALIRTTIQEVIDESDAIQVSKETPNARNVARAFTCVFVHLTEAKFAVGELIGEFQKEEKARKKAEKEEQKAQEPVEEQVEVVSTEQPVDETKENGSTEGEVQK